MNRHAKASSAGPTSGQGSRLGPIRRALATRASSFGSGGIGAPSHRGARLALALVLALAGALALTATPSLAVTPAFTSSFGSAGSGAGQLSLAPRISPQHGGSGVAVDESTGDIYVADTNNFRVDRFDAQGNFILAFGREVDQTTGGDVCTAASGDSCQAATPGSGGGALAEPLWVAVDNSTGPSAGDVYVGDIPGQIVSKFSPGGQFLFQNDGSNIPGGDRFGSAINGVTVDPQGNFWVYGFGAYEFSQAGTPLQSWPDLIGAENLTDIAVSNTHVFLLNGDGRMRRYGLSGENAVTVSRGDIHPQTFALNPTTEDLYLVDDGTSIAHFNASCTPIAFAPGSFQPNVGCAPNDTWGAGDLNNAGSIALNASSDTFYIAETSPDRIDVFTPPPPGPPVLGREWVSSIGLFSATLSTVITPVGNDTTCQLQYTDDASFSSSGYAGATSLPCNQADLGADFADHLATADIGGLAAGTTYHYRFLAHNVAGDVTGADHTVTTEIPEPALPDGRAYEQVSPAQKDNEPPNRTLNFMSALDGSRMAFYSINALPGSLADGRDYLSARGGGGWSTVNQIPPQSQSISGGFQVCALNFQASIAGHSADLSKSVLADGLLQGAPFYCGKDDPELVPGEPDGVQNLFLRDNVTGAYQLISLNPVTGPPAEAFFDAGSPDLSHVVFDEAAQLTADAPAGVNNLYDWSNGAVKLVAAGGTIAGGELPFDLHSVSADGSRIFFQGEDGNLYARENGSQTIQIDASHGAGPGGGGTFQFASTDGSVVFFTADASSGLTGGTVPGSGANLYRYDFSNASLTDLTPQADVNFLGFSGAGNSGSDAYFVATGNLAPGAIAGRPNLFVSHGGALSFIATLDEGYPEFCTWEGGALCARVSADGSHIAFNSDLNLTASEGGGADQVYLYDLGADQLVCASCGATGAAPRGSSTINAPETFGSSLFQYKVLSRSLSADGSRLFFESTGPLVANDTNGKTDVYEYENGKPHLISTGTSVTASSFVDASASGDDVFFTTAQQLTSSDGDGVTDVYDARVGGGFPEPSEHPACEAEACRGAGTSQSNVPGAGSGVFQGPGNRPSQRHHKKTHHKKRKHHHKRTAKHNRRAGK